jgi:hypothetical protein
LKDRQEHKRSGTRVDAHKRPAAAHYGKAERTAGNELQIFPVLTIDPINNWVCLNISFEKESLTIHRSIGLKLAKRAKSIEDANTEIRFCIFHDFGVT